VDDNSRMAYVAMMPDERAVHDNLRTIARIQDFDGLNSFTFLRRDIPFTEVYAVKEMLTERTKTGA
jgi:hypothetical protein